jgi:hypothetical protein
VIAPGAARSALADILQKGERIIWIGRPDPLATLRTQMFWWWLGVPAMAIAAFLYFGNVIAGEWSFPPFGIAFALLAAPFLAVVQAYGTIYAITDRRVIIRHDALGKKQVVHYPLGALDREFEILNTGRDVGHLYFISGARARVANADFTGKVAFRELKKPQEVAALLARVREKKS